jgi:hypothetical protein
LRAWIEAQLPNPYRTGPDGIAYGPPDYQALARRLSATLDGAGLTCGDYGSPGYRCRSEGTEEDERGYLGSVRIGSPGEGRYLVVVTGVGVRCGFDESAYIYEHRDGGWRLLLAIEEKDYGPAYSPRNFLSIDASPSGKAWNEPSPPPLVAALTFGPWCTSNWHMLATRLWRANPTTTTPRPLVDRSDSLFMGDYFIAAERLSADDLLVEFRGDSADPGRLVRSHVLHYRIDPGDRVRRIGPVALSPTDFVDEWLRSRWSEAGGWNEAGAPATLSRVHERMGDLPFGEFDPPEGCSDPTLWQLGFTPSTDGKDSPRLYFKLRWMPPYRFSLVDAGPRPFAGCDREAPEAEDKVGTLFPIQGWLPE